MTRIPYSRLLRRLTMLLFLGLCIALWPLAGYAATVLVASPEAENGVDGVDQAGIVVTKSVNPTQAEAGDTITYTFAVTNTGTLNFVDIDAVDSRLGRISGLEVALPAGASRTASVTYVVQATDPVGPLSNTVTVTGTTADGIATSTATAVVIIGAPTDLPVSEQPNQAVELYLPSIRPGR